LLMVGQVISGSQVELTALTMIGLAAVTAISAAAARWLHAALARRVDILSQALEASSDAQLIVAPDGRIAYANTAFHDLFPQSEANPLARIADAVADPDSGADFTRLRERAASGIRAIAALPLCDARGGKAGWFNI